MAPKKRIDLDSRGVDGDKGLTHNPFAGSALGKFGSRSETGSAGRAASESPEADSGDPESQAPGGGASFEALVRHERKGRGGKTVTVVELRGGDGSARGALVDELARTLGKALGTGCRRVDDTVELRGDVRDRVEVHLVSAHDLRVKRSTS